METSTTAIIGGTVVNDTWAGRATVLITDSYISGILAPTEQIPSSVDNIISAEGHLVIPGGVDPHCHVQTQMGGYTTLDDYRQASEAAIWGGTTTIIDFAIPIQGQSPWEAVTHRLDIAKQSICDTALHACVTEWTPDIPDQLTEMTTLGIRTVKLFTTYRDSVMATSDTVLQVMKCLSTLGGIAYIHAESNHLVEDAQRAAVDKDLMAARYHSRTRPEYTEAAAVSEVIDIAAALGTHAYFVHQSTAEAVALVRGARARGVRAYSETCPHYLLLTDACYETSEPERYVCCPPLRSANSSQRLRAAVTRGEIHTIGSDHNCFDLKQKLTHRDDVRNMPNGMPGVENRLPLMFSQFRTGDHSLDPRDLVRMLCANPAKLNGLYPKKGVIAPGADADIVILDRGSASPVGISHSHMQTDYTPYEDFSIDTYPTTVMSRGHLLIHDGQRTNAHPSGSHAPSEALTSHLLC